MLAKKRQSINALSHEEMLTPTYASRYFEMEIPSMNSRRR